MKLRTLVAVVVIVFLAGTVYAANGDLVVQGNATVSNLTVTGTFTAPHVMAKYYESPEQPITSGGSLPPLAHGLGTTPVLVQVWLKCKTAEGGYAVGDMLVVPVTQINYYGSGSLNQGASIVADSTNLNIRYGEYVNVWAILHKTTGAQFYITNANWKAIFRAWAF